MYDVKENARCCVGHPSFPSFFHAGLMKKCEWVCCCTAFKYIHVANNINLHHYDMPRLS